MENGVGSVLVLGAENVILALESVVARRLAGARKRFLDEPLGVSVEGLLDANTERPRDLVGRVGPDVLDVVAEAVVRVVTGDLFRVELGGLPAPGAALNGTADNWSTSICLADSSKQLTKQNRHQSSSAA